MKFGICILTGGKSSRMNYHAKAELKYKDKTFLDLLITTFNGYENKFISINSKQNYEYEGYQQIVDEYDAIGPLNGIVSCFHQSDVDALFVCGCDMPFLKAELIPVLLSLLEDYDGIFLEDDHHLYTTAGIYTRNMLPIMEEMIQKQNYRLYQCIKKCHVRIERTEEYVDESMLLNINTIEEYNKLEGK